MMQPLEDAEHLDQAIERFARIIERIQIRQSQAEHKLLNLYRMAAIAFALVVASLSFLVIILSQQFPAMTGAITDMNDRFTTVANNMARMDRSVSHMESSMERFPEIVANLDGMNASVTEMALDVRTMRAVMGVMDEQMKTMSLSVADMRQSFELMEANLLRIGHDVSRLSAPAKMFNQFNPFR